MNKVLTLLALLLSIQVWGKKNTDKQIAEIVAEGKKLYLSEMASWHGTDLFLQAIDNKEKIGGYFSYINDGKPTCIFYSKSEQPKVIGTMIFDTTFDLKTAKVDTTERLFTALENDYFQLTHQTREIMVKNDKGFFKFYNHTNPNIIPLIEGKVRKVYILTGTTEPGVVLFGNDYLLTFDKSNKLINKKQLHQNLIPIEYDGKTSSEEDITMHTHLPETGDFMTATDICTLMLYGKIAKWQTHQVISPKYLNIWSCETNQLNVIEMSIVEQINKHQEKENKK